MKTVLFASGTLEEKQRFITVKIQSIHLYASIHLHLSMQGTMSVGHCLNWSCLKRNKKARKKN